MNSWKKPILTLIALGFITWLAPSKALDPWHLLNIQKIFKMIFALTFIQVVGVFLVQRLGAKAGSVLTGLLGGLISSTATTAALARKSKISSATHSTGETLTFLAATSAMLMEGIAIVFMGTTETQFSNVLIFLGPLIASVIMIYFISKNNTVHHSSTEQGEFLILPILKLSFFILAILTLSKIVQNYLGQSGLAVVTSLISLFEIHGSVIANVQLKEGGVISGQFLNFLLSLSVIASYVSKIFLIWTLANQALRKRALQYTSVLFVVLVLSWSSGYFLNF